MKKARHALFAFDACDCEAAREWLTELYEEGWELEHLSWFFFLPARFVPRSRDDLKYCVDPIPYNGKSQVCPDGYDRLIDDSGWELIDCSNCLNVYRSKPGTDPAPIHTDPAMAKKRFLRVVLLPNLLGGLLLLALSLFYLVWIFLPDLLSFLASGFELYRAAGALLVLPWSLAVIVRTLLRYRRLAGGVSDPAAVHRARLFGVLTAVLLLMVLPSNMISTIRDIATEPWVDPAASPVYLTEGVEHARTERQASPFLEEFSTTGYVGANIYTQERYDCRFDWVADLAVSTRLDRARSGGLSPAPAELGFDESWTADGYLLLRQGNVVAELTGFPALTEPATLERIRGALELG